MGRKRQLLCTNYDRGVASPFRIDGVECVVVKPALTLWDANALKIMCTDLWKCVSCKNDGPEFDIIVYDDSSEDQHWLSSLLIIL